jgi:hypothetical protein
MAVDETGTQVISVPIEIETTCKNGHKDLVEAYSYDSSGAGFGSAADFCMTCDAAIDVGGKRRATKSATYRMTLVTH